MAMAGRKRALEDSTYTPNSKKPKNKESTISATTSLLNEEVDFPRGGGTSFTPLEVKNIRAEGSKEAGELFKNNTTDASKGKKRKRNSEVKTTENTKKAEHVRIEHLNYKRLDAGMPILGQVVSIHPLALIISLPNQLFGHVPITNLSTEFTQLLEKFDNADDNMSVDGDSEDGKPSVPELSDMFSPGQYVRTVVIAVHTLGSTDMSGIGNSRDIVAKSSRRVELSLVPEKVNSGVHKADIKAGYTLTSSVRSVEDHGYILELGVSGVSGFLPFKEARTSKHPVGQILNVTVKKLATNGCSCNVTEDDELFKSSSLSEITNVASILPGALVSCLITAMHTTGIVLQVLGFFDGSVEQLYFPLDGRLKLGQRVKARVLYRVPEEPPRFSLALAEHIIQLRARTSEANKSLQEAYPLGTIFDDLKVLRVDADRGVIVGVDSNVEGFVHISLLSDDHLASLSNTGPWKTGTVHRGRVIGYFPLDGILQLSLKPSLLQQKIFQVDDLHVGDIVKGTIKQLTDRALFVSLSESIDGVVWPNHFADIPLKHPAKRFRLGTTIKCCVLVVDPEHRRVALTVKKSLVDSSLPIISSFATAKVGIVTHGVIFRILDKSLMIEFFNNMKAIIPVKEIAEGKVIVPEGFFVGKVVKVQIISVDPDQRRIVASIRQANSNFKPFSTNLDQVEVGHVVEGELIEVLKDNAALRLIPSNIRALLSLNNLANSRGATVDRLRLDLKVGEMLDNLVVVARNVEKALIIVANKPKTNKNGVSKHQISLDTVQEGQVVSGRVTRYTRNGTLLKLTSHIGGILHPTDVSDDFDSGTIFPSSDTILRATVIGINKTTKQLTLSTRQSRLHPDTATEIKDREITDLFSLKSGDSVRGFVKSIADHGLFVTIGRGFDARVQIKELFDDFVKDWKPRFSVNQIVAGRILDVDRENNKVELSFRSGDLSKKSNDILSSNDLSVGQIVKGTVTRIEKFGLFVQLDNSKISGLCHKSELSDSADADVDAALENFNEGDRVKCVVLRVEKSKLSLTMKPSQFSGSNKDPGESDVEENDVDKLHHADNVEVVDEETSEEDEELVIVEQQLPTFISTPPIRLDTSGESTVPSLQLTGGFQWDTTIINQDNIDEDEPSEDEDEQRSKKRRRKQVEQDLTADLNNKAPESNSDFERLLLGSPNSSYLWIQYMAFQLQLSDVIKARTIARRAIETIHFREEQEKLNVWIALLNLECSYGTDESLESTFKDAAKANDSKTVHLRLGLIFDQAEKPAKAEEQYRRTAKKFGLSSKVWVRFSEHYLKRGMVEESRKLLPRALQSLDKRKHLKTISAFAQLEYKLGDAERGKTLFEGMVDSHPKRWDLWSVYIDMEAGQRDMQNIRNIFDRLFSIKMTSHKAKSFFKKWLDLEKRLGDDDGATTVKQKAVEWTQRTNDNPQQE